MHAPVLQKPPEEPLPDPTYHPSWYGEVWVRYPMAPEAVPVQLGQVLRARHIFRITMNEFCRAAYGASAAAAAPLAVTLDKADDLHAQLMRWYNELPPSLLPRAIVLPGHLQLQSVFLPEGSVTFSSICFSVLRQAINHPVGHSVFVSYPRFFWH